MTPAPDPTVERAARPNYLNLLAETYACQQAELEEVNAMLMRDLADALADKDIYRELTQRALAMVHAARLDAERERTQRLALSTNFTSSGG